MKRALLLFLLLAAPLMAKTPPATPQPSVQMAPQRTVQEDLELRDWIVGIQTTAQDAVSRADSAEKEAQLSREKTVLAEAEAKSSRDHSAIAEAKANEAETRLADVQTKFNAAEDERDKAIGERDKAIGERDVEHKGRVAAEAHVSKIKTYLGFAFGGLFAFVVFYLLSQFPLPPPLGLYVRFGAPVLAFGIGWLLVARFV